MTLIAWYLDVSGIHDTDEDFRQLLENRRQLFLTIHDDSTIFHYEDSLYVGKKWSTKATDDLLLVERWTNYDENAIYFSLNLWNYQSLMSYLQIVWSCLLNSRKHVNSYQEWMQQKRNTTQNVLLNKSLRKGPPNGMPKFYTKRSCASTGPPSEAFTSPLTPQSIEKCDGA